MSTRGKKKPDHKNIKHFSFWITAQGQIATVLPKMVDCNSKLHINKGSHKRNEFQSTDFRIKPQIAVENLTPTENHR